MWMWVCPQRRRVRPAADVRGGGVSVRVRTRRREVGVPPEGLVLERRHMRVHVRQPHQFSHLLQRLPVRRAPLLQLRQHKVHIILNGKQTVTKSQ